MIDGDAFQDVLEDVRILVEREAHPARGTLRLSGEVAALIEGVGGAAEDVGAAAGDATAEDVEAGLAALEEAVGRCAGCGLAEGRTHVVFGEGSPRADLVFVGEAPGFNEDKAGKPFVGAAGRLLTDIIVKGMKLRRRDVYICNVLKCRPPNNRDPRADEIERCVPYLIRQIELIRPKVICALGGHAAKTLLDTTESTSRLRGKWHWFRGIPLRVTYHPSYLLHKQDNPAAQEAEKRKVWEDIQHVMRLLDGTERPVPPDGGPNG